MKVWSIVVAAGSGTRFGAPKQLELIGGTQVVVHAVRPLLEQTCGVVLVTDTASAMVGIPDSVIVVSGGSTRSESVRLGLAAVPTDATHILVHDGARPLVSAELIKRVVEKLKQGAKAVVPTVPVRDTLREVGGATVDRSKFLAVQTPQGFSAPEFRQAQETGLEGTDDASVMEASGYNITTVSGDVENIKITFPSDIFMAEAFYGTR